MHIIHLYPPHIPELAQYVSMLTELSGERCEATDEVKTFLAKCEEGLPDIVHLHGCRQADYIKAALTARQKGARIVLSPHGQLESWELKERVNLPLGLREMVSHAYCVIVRSSIEADEFKKLAWNTRVEIIRNPILTRTINQETCLEKHRIVYQQVMDSYALEKLSNESLNALKTLLKVGITGDRRWGEPFDTTTVDWHKLLIYAQLEGISPYIKTGCRLMGIDDPEKTIAPSYLPDQYVSPTSMTGKTIPEMVYDSQQLTAEGHLSLLTLAELDQALRKDNVEDDVVMEQLQDEKLDGFFAALLTVLHEQTGLTEGFMPCRPIDNEETKQIRTTIQKHLEI